MVGLVNLLMDHASVPWVGVVHIVNNAHAQNQPRMGPDVNISVRVTLKTPNCKYNSTSSVPFVWFLQGDRESSHIF